MRNPYYMGTTETGKKHYCLYPNIYYEVLYASDALSNMTKAAGVTYELFKEVLINGEELIFKELCGLLRRIEHVDLFKAARVSLKYLASPIPSILSPDKGRWRYKLREMEDKVDEVIGMVKTATKSYSSIDYNRLMDYYACYQENKTLPYAMYRAILHLIGYFECRLKPEPEPTLRGVSLKGALPYEH